MDNLLNATFWSTFAMVGWYIRKVTEIYVLSVWSLTTMIKNRSAIDVTQLIA